MPDRTIVDTSGGRSDGLVKCPRCGSAELEPRGDTIVCLFCRYSWPAGTDQLDFHTSEGIELLEGVVIGSGADDIQAEAAQTVTIKCQGCGAEVVIHTENALQARCHWCRQTLSINNRLPNGAVPDAILPFGVGRDQAVQNIERFVKSRKFWLRRDFVRQFEPGNVLGVYMPYMVVDVNAHVWLSGEGEVETRQYTVKVGDSHQTRYDADVYRVQRDFDLYIDDLTIESATRYAMDTEERGAWAKLTGAGGPNNTNNVINTVLPFDTQQAVRFNANYMKGFSSERRDLNIDPLARLVRIQGLGIGRRRALDTVGKFDRGVQWQEESIALRGTRWVSMYLPVWLYSFMDTRGGQGGMTHYIAVNGRTGETMGSMPISVGRVWGMSTLVAFLSALLLWPMGFAMLTSSSDDGAAIGLLLLATPLLILLFMGWGITRWCRNYDKSHHYEEETRWRSGEVGGGDAYVTERTGMSNPAMSGRNQGNHRMRVNYVQIEPDGPVRPRNARETREYLEERRPTQPPPGSSAPGSPEEQAAHGTPIPPPGPPPRTPRLPRPQGRMQPRPPQPPPGAPGTQAGGPLPPPPGPPPANA